MKASAREKLITDISRLMAARLLWVVLPARRELGLCGKQRLAELVTWATDNVSEDVRAIVDRYEVRDEALKEMKR
jgi:hypothetical protein